MTLQFTIHAAKTHLSKPIEAALSGEDVVIAKGTKRVVKLVPIPQAKFRIGILGGQPAGPAPNFLEPMAESDLDLWEGRR